MYKVVRKSDVIVRKISDDKIAINYITKELSPDVSFAITEAKNYKEKQKAEYNRIYYVLEGTLMFIFGKEEVKLKSSDSCYVAKDTEYTMLGTFKAVVVNQPAFGT